MQHRGARAETLVDDESAQQYAARTAQRDKETADARRLETDQSVHQQSQAERRKARADGVDFGISCRPARRARPLPACVLPIELRSCRRAGKAGLQ